MQPETDRLKELLRYALLDINHMLVEGFDTNADDVGKRDPYMDGVTATIREIMEVLGITEMSQV